MSYAVFPVLRGLMWDLKKRPTWNTAKMLTAGGNEFRTGYRQNPITEFDLSYSYMSLTDKLTLEGFFNQQQGSLVPFYFDAQNDDTVTNFGFGVGNGAQTAFTLLKPAGTGASEPIGGPNVITAVYVNGVSTSAYTISGNILTFTTAPANTYPVTWTGGYYYLVRFNDDVLEFNQFSNLMYELMDCKLVSVQ